LFGSTVHSIVGNSESLVRIYKRYLRPFLSYLALLALINVEPHGQARGTFQYTRGASLGDQNKTGILLHSV